MIVPAADDERPTLRVVVVRNPDLAERQLRLELLLRRGGEPITKG